MAPSTEAARLPDALLEPSAYGHAASDIRLIETHVSWVFLAGSCAYKVKKPVRLSFLDYSTPDRRRRSCEDELRVNRRFAPALYCGLSRVTLSKDGAISVDGHGATIDWAVRMRRFDVHQQLDELIAAGSINDREMADLGRRLAASHAEAPAADARADWCTADRTMAGVRDTSRSLSSLWPQSAMRLAAVETRAEARWLCVETAQRLRREHGRFRECHGDLHCANVARIDGRLTPFDALEFDPSLSWIDPVNDVAFLLMDLDARGRADLAAATLDGWLEVSGDYEGLAPIRLFQCYRALVRALVHGIQATQRPLDPNPAEARTRYLDAAERHSMPRQPELVVVAGLSGSGKSWLASRLLAPLGGARVRSDVERKRLAGIAPGASSGGRIYTPEFTARTYARIADAAGAILDAGYHAIVDAACLLRAERDALRDLACRRGVPYRLVWVTASIDVCAARLEARRSIGGDPSEATVDVFRAQQSFVEPPQEAELSGGLWLDSSNGVDMDTTLAALRDRAPLTGDHPGSTTP